MRKVGQNETSNESDDSSSASDGSEEDGNHNAHGQQNRRPNDRNGQSNSRYYNNRNGNGEGETNYYGSMRPNGMNVAGSYGSDRGVNPNGYQNWNNGGAYGYNHNYQNNSVATKGNGTAKNQTGRDQACLVHCFFHELQLVMGPLLFGICSEQSLIRSRQATTTSPRRTK